MEDSKIKLAILGALLVLIVGGIFVMSTMAPDDPVLPCSTGDCAKTPIDILVKNYDKYQGDYPNAVIYYNKIVPIVDGADDNVTKDVWLSRLREKHVEHSSDQIVQFCSIDSLDIDRYTLLRDNAKDLKVHLEGKDHAKSSYSDIDEKLTILYRFYNSYELENKIRAKQNTSAYTDSGAKTFNDEIAKYETTDYIKTNPYVISKLGVCKDKLNSWQRSHKNYTDIEDKFRSKDYTGVVNCNCQNLSSYYKSLCESKRELAYNHFTDWAETKEPSSIASSFLEKVDCNKIKNAPGDYYKTCVKRRVKLKDIVTKQNANPTYQ